MKRTRQEKKLRNASKSVEQQRNATKSKLKPKTNITEQNLLKQALKSTKDFFKNTYKNIKKNANKIIKYIHKHFGGAKNPNNFKPGTLLNFQYQAKDVTQVFDKAPLCIMLGPPKNPKLAKTHTFGLNLHWADLKQRVALAHLFLKAREDNSGALTYEMTKAILHKYKKSPMLRMYIIANISTKVYEIDEEMFITAAALPSERWAGGK